MFVGISARPALVAALMGLSTVMATPFTARAWARVPFGSGDAGTHPSTRIDVASTRVTLRIQRLVIVSIRASRCRARSS
jgi:hypothetical protein